MRVKILHIIGDSKFGGASNGIVRLACHWKSHNWPVQILTTDPGLQQLAAAENVDIVPLDVIWRATRPLKDLAGLWKLYRFLRNSDFTLVHTHTTKAGFVGRLAAWMAGIPIVLHTAHGFAFHETSPWWKKAACTLLDRVASWGCRYVITVSQFHKDWGSRLGIAAPEKLVAISNGIPDPDKPNPAEIQRIRKEWGVSKDQVAILTPGRLAPEKGLEDLLDAIARIETGARKNLHWFIAGEGALRYALEQRARTLGISAHVTFLGFQKNVPALLTAADLVVLPTWREGLSIALLEAMAQGCAILTTTIGSNREVTSEGEAARLIPPGNVERLAVEMAHLAGNLPERLKLGRRAREIYLERYTLDRMLGEYHQLYKQLFEESEYAQSVSPLLSSPHR